MDLQHYLARRPPDYADTAALGHCLRALVEAGLDQLPLPGSGLTLERFQRLAEVGGHDLGLCKLYEGHTDALAIIEQLGVRPRRAAPGACGPLNRRRRGCKCDRPGTWCVSTGARPGVPGRRCSAMRCSPRGTPKIVSNWWRWRLINRA